MQEHFVKTYVITGTPVPLARPRLSKSKVYDSQMAEKLVCGLELRNQHHGLPLYKGQLHLHATFFMPIPGYKKRKICPGEFHSIKPDLDNLIKFLLDVSQDILFANDASISSCVCSKVYDDEPRTEFSIRVLH